MWSGASYPLKTNTIPTAVLFFSGKHMEGGDAVAKEKENEL